MVTEQQINNAILKSINRFNGKCGLIDWLNENKQFKDIIKRDE